MKEMGRVFWTHGVGLLGMGATAVFVPIFLLNSGHSFRTVLLFLLGQHLLATVLQLPIGKLFTRISPHHLMALGLLWQVVFFGIIGTLSEQSWALIPLALAWAMYRSIYWPAFHYVFGTVRAHKKTGQQVAGTQVLKMLATTLAPAIGGIVATLFGITSTYVAAAVILLIAILPMLKSRTGPDTVGLRFNKAEIKKIRPDLTANYFNGSIIATETSAWPLLVFIIVSTYAGVGVLSSVIAAASIAVALFVGRHERIHGEKHYLKQGMLTYSLTSLARTVVQNALHVFGANLFAGIGKSLYATPYLSRYYANSDGQFRLEYVLLMEAAFSLGAMTYVALLLLLSFFLAMETVLIVGVALAAFAILGLRLIR